MAVYTGRTGDDGLDLYTVDLGYMLLFSVYILILPLSYSYSLVCILLFVSIVLSITGRIKLNIIKTAYVFHYYIYLPEKK